MRCAGQSSITPATSALKSVIANVPYRSTIDEGNSHYRYEQYNEILEDYGPLMASPISPTSPIELVKFNEAYSCALTPLSSLESARGNSTTSAGGACRVARRLPARTIKVQGRRLSRVALELRGTRTIEICGRAVPTQCDPYSLYVVGSQITCGCLVGSYQHLGI